MAVVLSSIHGESPTGPDRLITDDEAGGLLGVGRSTVKALRRDGVLPTIHVKSAARIRLSDVQRLIREGTR